MTLTFNNIIELIVPHFLLISFFSPLSAYLIIHNSLPGLSVIPIILSLSFAVLAFNTMNMIYDLKLDAQEKPLRPLPSGKVSTKEATMLVFIFLGMSLAISFLTTTYFFLLIALFLIVAFSYSYPKIYLKKFYWSSAIVGTILYGIIPFIAVYYSNNEPMPWFFLFLFSAFFFIVSNTKDFEDIEGEKNCGINSFPLKFGWNNSRKFIILGIGLLIVLTGILSFTNYLPYKYLYASIISFILFLPFVHLFNSSLRKLRYQHIIYKELNNMKIKNIISQSEVVTISVLMVLLIELIYGLVTIIRL